MPRVVTADAACRQLAGGLAAFDVEANTVRRMIAELERRHPGLGAHIDRRMAVAIDGEIHQDAGDTPLAATSEVYLIPKIGGG